MNRRLLILGVAALSAACSSEEKTKANDTSGASAESAAVDLENPGCDSVRNYTPSDAFVTVSLDSAAAEANRLLISVIKDEGQPFRAKLLATTGSAECRTGTKYVAFRVREPQSYLSIVIHTTTDHVGVSVKRMERNAGSLAMRAFGSDGTQQELVWNGAQRAFQRSPLIDEPGSGPQRNPNIGKPPIRRPRRP